MTNKKENGLKRRTNRELRFISMNDKLRYAALIMLGFPLLALINVVFVLRVIDLFGPSSTAGFISLLAFTAMIGIAAIGADFWLVRWLIEEFDVFRWTSSGERPPTQDGKN